MGIISAHELGVNVPEIPNRRERRRRFKKAGGFKHQGGWQHVNRAANMQRENAIKKATDLANKKLNAQEKSDEKTTKN